MHYGHPTFTLNTKGGYNYSVQFKDELTIFVCVGGYIDLKYWGQADFEAHALKLYVLPPLISTHAIAQVHMIYLYIPS